MIDYSQHLTPSHKEQHRARAQFQLGGIGLQTKGNTTRRSLRKYLEKYHGFTRQQAEQMVEAMGLEKPKGAK
ncbi:hypothetical protein [Marinobacter sp. MBR-105]|jgi:hypothetical protein